MLFVRRGKARMVGFPDGERTVNGKRAGRRLVSAALTIVVSAARRMAAIREDVSPVAALSRAASDAVTAGCTWSAVPTLLNGCPGPKASSSKSKV